MHIVLLVLAREIRQEKKINSINIEVKLCRFTNDRMLNTENS